MRNLLLILFSVATLISCENEPVINPFEYNSNLTIKQNLTNGVTVLDILNYNDQ